MLEDAERRVGDLEIGAVIEDRLRRGARERVERRPGRDPARPRRPAAAELEEVLPGREAAALRTNRDHVVEKLLDALGVAGPGMAQAVRDLAVDHPKVGELLILQTLS